MNKVPIIVGVTGHRDICIEEKERVKKQFRQFLDLLQQEYPHTEIIVASGLAVGADTYAVEGAQEKIQGKAYSFIGLLPMEKEKYLEDFDSKNSISQSKEYSYLDNVFSSEREQFKNICRQAKVVHEGPYYSDQEYEDRSQYYVDLGKRLSEYSDYLVAFYDNREALAGNKIKSGGTRDVIRMRVEGTDELNANEFCLATNNEEKGLLIIPTLRDSSSVYGKKKESTNVVDEPEMLKVIKEKKDMKLYNEYNGHASTYKPDIKNHRLFKALKNNNINFDDEKESCHYFLESFLTTDGLAIEYKKNKDQGIYWLFLFVFIGILAFEAYGIFEWIGFLNVYFLTCIFAIVLNSSLTNGYKISTIIFFTVVVIMINKPYEIYFYVLSVISILLLYYLRKNAFNKIKNHRNFVDYRLLAELIRVQFFWNIAGIKEKVFDKFPLKSRSIIIWQKKAMQSMSLVYTNDMDFILDEKRTNFIIEEWIVNQKDYYAFKAKEHSKDIDKKNRYPKYAYGIAVLSIFISIILMKFGNTIPSKALIIILVVLAVSAIAIIVLLSNKVNFRSYKDQKEETILHKIKTRENLILFTASIIGVIIVSVLMTWGVMLSPDILIIVLVSLSGFVIAVTALLSDKISVNSYEDLEERYNMMEQAYTRAEELLLIRPQEDRKKIIYEVGIEAINEYSDWYFYQRNNDGKLF
jgi:hypothetical protein